MPIADLARVVDDDYLGDFTARSTDELREMRAECQQVEAKISFLRRLVQGRLDIVSSELSRREAGGPPSDLSALVEQLPQILADKSRPPGPGRMPTNLLPPDDDEVTRELDGLSGPRSMASLPDMTDGELRSVADRLGDFEREVSEQRRAVFVVIDSLQAELARRWEHDQAD